MTMMGEQQLITPHLILREHSKVTPADHELLQGMELSVEDRSFLATLTERIRVDELRSGLRIETGSFIGSVQLSGLRLSIVPKIGLGGVMDMIRYTYKLNPTVYRHTVAYDVAQSGLVDLFAEALLSEVERLARRGLSAFYKTREEALSMPRGRISMRSAATRIGRVAVECRYDEFTSNTSLNQTLAAGLRLASRVVMDRNLSFRLLRTRDRYLCDQDPIQLDRIAVKNLIAGLDRRTSHYSGALIWIKMLVECCRLGRHESSGESSQFGFLLNMNLLFERFLERFFESTAPPGYWVATQSSFGSIYRYTLNPRGWSKPTLRPDLVFHKRGRVMAVGDAKYKDRTDQSLEASELYQLTMYGLMVPQRLPRQVFLFHPLATGLQDQPCALEFDAPGAPAVKISVVGVPVARILEGEEIGWGELRVLAGEG
jgi:5-methylcytosine-specific restriction enzyme subunit McrC